MNTNAGGSGRGVGNVVQDNGSHPTSYYIVFRGSWHRVQ